MAFFDIFNTYMMFNRKILTEVYLIAWVFGLTCFGQIGAQIPWQDITPSNDWSHPSQLQLNNYRAVGVNIGLVRQHYLNPGLDSLSLFAFPLPNGQSHDFLIWEDQLLPPGMASRYPGIRTYTGIDPQNPRLRIKVDIGAYGLHAMIIGGEEQVFLDPASFNRDDQYITYAKRQAKAVARTCMLNTPVFYPGQGPMGGGSNKNQVLSNSGQNLFTFRLASSTTAEYSQKHGGSDYHILSSLVTALHRSNAVFERDLAMRFTFAENSDSLFFKDPAYDPFTSVQPSALDLAMENDQALLNLPDSTYDLAICFSDLTESYSKGLSCDSTKSLSSVGLPFIMGSPFDPDQLAHQLGHCFGANHTNNGNCSRVASAAFEPAGGSTIMAMKGQCIPALDGPGHLYFHAHSIVEISDFVNSGPGDCGKVHIQPNNTPPAAQLPQDIIYLPPSTPLKLYPNWSMDSEQGAITHCWEQHNLGPIGHPNNPSGSAPLFRSLPPTASSTRYLPQWQSLVREDQVLGELLPSYSRDLRFKLSLRDNHFMGGAVSQHTLDMHVLNNCPPFEVLQPRSHHRFLIDQPALITWNVGLTADSLINCQNVNIYFSKDSGWTIFDTIAFQTANDGRHMWHVPAAAASPFARVIIEAADQYFLAFGDVFSVERGIVALEENQLREARIYPNPVKQGELLFIDVYGENFHSSDLLQFSLSSLDGKVLKQGYLRKSPGDKYSIKIPELAGGLYLLTLQDSELQNGFRQVQRLAIY